MMALVSALDLGFGKLVFAIFTGGDGQLSQPGPTATTQLMEQHVSEQTTSRSTSTEQHVSEQYDPVDRRADRRADATSSDEAADGRRGPAEVADETDADEADATVDEPSPRPPTRPSRRAADEPSTSRAETVEADAGRRGRRAEDGRRGRPRTPSDAEADEADPLEEFRRELWAKPGDWFVVHTYSGMENRVKSNLENRIISLNMEDYIHEIVVPTEEVAEIKNGQRKMVKRTVLPGYVLVRMDLTDESWAAVRHTPSVTGFVGHSHQPVPLSMDEVENMLAPAVVAAAEAEAVAAGTGQRRRRHRQEAGRGRRLRRLRLGHGRRRPVRHAARDDHRDQRRVPEGQGPRRDLRPGDPGRAELQPDPEGLRLEPEQRRLRS